MQAAQSSTFLPCPLLQRLAADDVHKGEASPWSKHARRFGKDAVFDRGKVDNSVRDDHVEDAVLEGESIDGSLGKLDLSEPVPIPQPRRLLDLLVGEVNADHASGLADLEGGTERVRP